MCRTCLEKKKTVNPFRERSLCVYTPIANIKCMAFQVKHSIRTHILSQTNHK